MGNLKDFITINREDAHRYATSYLYDYDFSTEYPGKNWASRISQSFAWTKKNARKRKSKRGK